MSNVGIQDNFVDTQDSILKNETDAKTYIQLTDLILDIDSNVTKHHLTDDSVDNVFDLRALSIQGNMWLTTEEWFDLLTLTVDVEGVRPVKKWSLLWTAQSGDSQEVLFDGQLKTLRAIDSGIGAVQLFFRIEGDEIIF